MIFALDYSPDVIGGYSELKDLGLQLRRVCTGSSGSLAAIRSSSPTMLQTGKKRRCHGGAILEVLDEIVLETTTG